MKCCMCNSTSKKPRNLPEHLSGAAGLKLMKNCRKVNYPVSFYLPALRSKVCTTNSERALPVPSANSPWKGFQWSAAKCGSFVPFGKSARAGHTWWIFGSTGCVLKSHSTLCKASNWCGAYHPEVGHVLDSIRSGSEVGFSFVFTGKILTCSWKGIGAYSSSLTPHAVLLTVQDGM